MPLAHCTLKVKGLDCPVEAKVLTEALENADGVQSIGFDLIHGTMTIGHDPERTDPDRLIARVATLAKMKAELLTVTAPRREWDRRMIPAAAGFFLLLAAVVGRFGDLPFAERALLLAAVGVGAIELLPKAVSGVRRMRPDIHVLMAFAIVGALLVGEWEEAATIAFLFALSEALESHSLSRARKAVHRLIDATPAEADLQQPDGSFRQVAQESVKRGNRLRVRPGAVVPADGIVVEGRSSVDAKAVTGESVPVLVEPGEPISAGGVNGDGTLLIEATSDARDSVVARIAAQVREAQARRAPIEKSIERFAAWYTPAVLAISLTIMIAPPVTLRLLSRETSFLDWFNRGLVVLVASCPCALVVSTPVALASAVAAAGRRGILLRGGPFLEEFGRLKAIAFDKTGTLTLGEPSVVEIVSRTLNDGGTMLLRIAAAVGEQGGHVLGRAISRHARERDLTIPSAESYRAVPGLGATATVDAVEYYLGSHRWLDESGVCRPDFHRELGEAEREFGTAVALSAVEGPIGWIRLADSIRPEAAEALKELRDLGIRTAMLTGDNSRAAEAIGSVLGLDESYPSLLPEDKARLVAVMIDKHGPTGMVGDGVNDAPALAASRVSVVLGDTATGTAMNAADVVLLSRDLRDLPWLVRRGRETIRCIHANIALALGVKAAVILVAATGIVVGAPALWLAVGADVGTTLVVTANALRLLRAS